MLIRLISPRLAVQKGDFLGSGVPYWPVEMAIAAAFLRERGCDVRVSDLFGSDPRRLEDRGDHYLQGRAVAAADAGVSDGQRAPDLFLLYALSYMSHAELLAICRALRAWRPDAKIAAFENSQAVTAYAIDEVAADFFDAGADAVVCGEIYWNWPEVERAIVTGEADTAPENVLLRGAPSKIARRRTEKHGRYPVPAWDLFPVANYWALPYSHGPKQRTYLPVLTSRGCPYPCDFCVVPKTNEARWRARDPGEVVDELIALRDAFGVRDFQVEDLNPTVKGSRWLEICEKLVARDAGVRFCFVSGTKAETIKPEHVPLYARAGCRYISISPESGSRDVMKAIGKPFDYAHGEALVRACHDAGIYTQACFLVGHPAETAADFLLSEAYLKRLVRSGLDEVAVFVVAPLAGSRLHRDKTIPIASASSLVSFSPRGRLDWVEVSRRRRVLIRTFFIAKLARGPALWLQGLRALFGVPRTKMENLPRRVLFIWWLVLRTKLRGRHADAAAG